MSRSVPTAVNNWGAFGDDDELGTLNYLTTDAVLRGVGAVVTGERHTLNLPLNLPEAVATGGPMFKPKGAHYSKESFSRNLLARHGLVINDDQVTFATQASSQWDALVHVGFDEDDVDGIFYNGFDRTVVSESGRAERLGIDKVASVGIAGRGVLLDLARMLAGGSADALPLDHRCTLEETLACVQHQRVELRPGDIVCFRTGWAEKYLQSDDDHRRAMGLQEDGSFQSAPGITADHIELAHVSKWAVIAADNPGVEKVPIADPAGSAHVRMLRNLGMLFGELLHFGTLADAAAADHRYDFLFVAVPLWIPGGAGSPANAMAIR